MAKDILLTDMLFIQARSLLQYFVKLIIKGLVLLSKTKYELYKMKKARNSILVQKRNYKREHIKCASVIKRVGRKKLLILEVNSKELMNWEENM